MSEMITWLRQQLDDDERVARAAKAEPWNFYSDGHYGAVAEFLNRWDPTDPARVLAEVEAKRRILDEHAPDDADLERKYCTRCGDWPTVEWPCPTVRLLAQPYAGRDGWRDEWRV
jgi:hypothetical protein